MHNNNFDDDELLDNNDPHLLDSQLEDFDDNNHLMDESDVNSPDELMHPPHSRGVIMRGAGINHNVNNHSQQ